MTPLRESRKCKLHHMLAYAMALYCLASVYYFVRSGSAGTPFSDSLTEEQVIIKEHSSNVRKWIFIEGVFLAGAYLTFAKPFQSCS